MTYDPHDNARHLAPAPDPQYDELRTQQESMLQGSVDIYNAQLSMFQSRGWQGVKAWLEESLKEAQQDLQKHRPGQQMGDVEYVRGQVQAFETFANLPEIVRMRRDYALQLLRQRQHAGA